jgi:Protein of unknown function DUF262
MNSPELRHSQQWSEDLDGPAIDPDEDESIVQPFDPAKIRVESRSMSLDLLLHRIEYDELDLAPDFQRRAGLWKNQAKSLLIESILIRIPLPAFYLDATDDTRWSVIDGLQRLSILKEFVIDGVMKLEGMEFLSELDGKTYSEIPRNLQRRILETNMTVFLIEKGTPPEVKFNIYKRINTGGLPLTSQEMRHALYQGKATKLLQELAELVEFQRATCFSIPTDRMIDREFVLRFLAFTIIDPYKYISAEFDSFLGHIMWKINIMSDQEIELLKSTFKFAMINSYALLGRYAFRKMYHRDSKSLPVNKSLFEAWSVNLAKLNSVEFSLLEQNREILFDGFIELMSHKEFVSSISQGTGSSRRVKIRFKSIQILIQYCLLEDKDRLKQPFREHITDLLQTNDGMSYA